MRMGLIPMTDDELERIKQKKLRELLRASDASSNPSQTFHRTPIVVTDASFQQTIQQHALVVVDCWAIWCAPCRMIAPVIESLAQDYAGKIVFAKLDVDQNSQTSHHYQIQSIPTLLVFKNGRLVDRLVGALPRQLLEPRIIRHLN
jgi:thioredoxin 1